MRLLMGGEAHSSDMILHGPWIFPTGLGSAEYEVRFPPNEASAAIAIELPDDNLIEGSELATLALQWPKQYFRAGETRVTVPIPGWDLREQYGGLMWRLARPPYVIRDSQVRVRIEDAGGRLTGDEMSIGLRSDGAVVVRTQGMPGRLHILEAAEVAGEGWSPLRTNRFFTNEAAFTTWSPRLPISSGIRSIGFRSARNSKIEFAPARLRTRSLAAYKSGSSAVTNSNPRYRGCA